MTFARLMRALPSGTALLAAVYAGGAVPGAHEQPPSRAANTWLIFIDDLHIDFRDTGRLRTLVVRALQSSPWMRGVCEARTA